MVGEIGFEPTTPWTQTKCATKLRHSPILKTAFLYVLNIWCGRRDLNSHAVKHWNLNPACLPIPPLPHYPREESLWHATNTLRRLGWTMGFEPTTAGITIRSSTSWATPTTVFFFAVESGAHSKTSSKKCQGVFATNIRFYSLNVIRPLIFHNVSVHALWFLGGGQYEF